MQKTKLRMWGNSYAVRLPKALIETIGLNDGSEFQVLYKDKQIILKEID
jgi:antitoxin MazE